jgi:hypothetical protein
MTPSQAAALLPIITAYAEGKTIQILSNRRWVDQVGNVFFQSPPGDYRIKPERRTVWININKGPYGYTYPSREQADESATPHRTACFQATYEEGEGLS